MARKMISTWELHIEKAVLGLAVLLLLGGTAYFMLMGAPYQDNDWTGQPITPSEAGSKLAKVAEDVQNQFRNVPKHETWVIPEKGGGREAVAFGLTHSDLQPTLPPLQPPPPLLIDGGDTGSSVHRPRPLVQIVPPGRPQVKVFKNADVGGAAAEEGKESKPLPWVMCASSVDLARQAAEFKKAGYPTDRWELLVYQVDMQRRQVLKMTEREVAGPWEDVEIHESLKVAAPLPDVKFDANGAVGNKERIELDTFAKALREPPPQGGMSPQPLITRPDPPRVGTGDTFKDATIPYLRKDPTGFYDPKSMEPAADPEMTKAARDWKGEAEKALKAKDYETAYMFAEAGYWAKGVNTQVREDCKKLLDDIDKAYKATGATPPKRDENRRRMPIVAYDIKPIDAGHYYQYRMRLTVLNRYAGHPGDLARPEDAKSLLIHGAWSEPSGTVEIKSDVYAFLTKVDGQKHEAQFEVFRIIPGGVDMKKYSTVKIGEAVGRNERVGNRPHDYSTGLVLVDIDSNYLWQAPGSATAEPTQAVICADPSKPEILRQRIVAQDLADLKYKELNALKEGRGQRTKGGPRG